jgi:cytoskeletal protein RodZ
MQTIGQRLKTARVEKRLTLDKVFEATRIRIMYLQALESDDLSSMPSPVQARGYLRNYAEYLELDIDQLLADLRSSPISNEIIGPVGSTIQLETQTPVPIPDQLALLPSPPAVEPEPKNEPQSEPVGELSVESRLDVTDSLWQTWLNRVSSVIPKRTSRKTETQVDPVTEEVEPEIQADELEVKPSNLEPSNHVHSTQIFKEIGAKLRSSRDGLSLHLNEVERNTHVKTHYLEALEQGDMDKLPSTVQTRGMLSNYASFLDLDVDIILLRFADGLQARHREMNPGLARPGGQASHANMPPLRSFIAGDMIFGIGMAVLIVGFVVWGINRVVTLQSQREIQPTAPSISDVLLASPDPSLFTPTATLLPVESFLGEATPTIIIPTVNVNVSVQVNLVAVERTYMRVIVDGNNVFEGRVVPGVAYFYEAENQVEVLVGSGAAIRIAYNGRDLGLLGGFGEIVSNIYRADGVVTPTPLPTALPTNTVPPTATLRPTSTSRLTSTPVPSVSP